MSRCFPFPPPGYEKKIVSTHSDVLKKEKQREKKHKKEKKDREKKDRDKSDGKNRDKKEKRRDKKKERERDKGQQSDNPNTLADTRLKVQPPGHSGQNVIKKDSVTCSLPDQLMVSGRTAGHNEKEGYHGRCMSLAKEPNGVMFMRSADRAVTDDAESGGARMMQEKIIPSPHNRMDGSGRYHNNHLGNNFEDSNLALELDRRLRNEAEQPYDQSQIPNKFIIANQKRDGGVIKSTSSYNMERGDKNFMGSNGRYVGDKAAEVTLVPYTFGLDQGNHDRIPRPSLSNDIEKKIEGRERINHQEDELQQRGKKRKDEERNENGKSHEKHKSRDKEKRHDKSNNTSYKMDTLCAPNTPVPHTADYKSNITSKDEKLNQAKGFLTNGIIHVTGPGMLSKPSPSLKENGKVPESYQSFVKQSLDGQGATSKLKTDKVEKRNGIIETHVETLATEQVIQARPRSPHPDAKRFADILAVPKIEELPEIDDSDWLFSKEKSEKKHKADDSRNSSVADTPQVWSKATIIESADVYALPYVVPY